VGLLRNPIHVTLNEVKGPLILAESSSRRFFAALRMTRGDFFNSPTVTYLNPRLPPEFSSQLAASSGALDAR
jgi:hypothetical protein